MDFLRAISNNQEPVLDEEYDKLLTEIENQQLDEKTALDRVTDRVEKRNIALYRPLVGVENLMLVRRFLDITKDKSSVPSTIMNGYYPIVKMVDEIVTAGPSYVQLLQALHKRAKKDS
jgi:hypothetical protein